MQQAAVAAGVFQSPIYKYGGLLTGVAMVLFEYLAAAGIFLLVFTLMGVSLN